MQHVPFLRRYPPTLSITTTVTITCTVVVESVFNHKSIFSCQDICSYTIYNGINRINSTCFSSVCAVRKLNTTDTCTAITCTSSFRYVF